MGAGSSLSQSLSDAAFASADKARTTTSPQQPKRSAGKRVRGSIVLEEIGLGRLNWHAAA